LELARVLHGGFVSRLPYAETNFVIRTLD